MDITFEEEDEMQENEVFITGTTVGDIQSNIEQQQQQVIDTTQLPRNRAERRALAKKLGKKGRKQFDSTTQTIGETAKKLDYISLIQKLRELNDKKEKENEENEATED